MSVQAKAYGTVACPKCETVFDINNPGGGSAPEKKPAARQQLTPAEILFRFIVWGLGSSVVLGIINEILKHK